MSTTAPNRRLFRSRDERAADKADARARAARAKLDEQRIRAQADAEQRQAREQQTAARRDQRPPRPLEDKLTLAAATIATVVAGQGMWTFLERVLGPQYADGQLVDPGVPVWLRGLMFAFVEVAVVTSAVRARRNMREKLSAGIDGLAVWALTGVSAVLAATEARSLPEVLFRLAAPLIAAWLWERGMSIERQRVTGRGRIHWRFTPERILVRVGLAEPTERTAGEVDAQRRLTKVALAADRAADAKPDSRRHRRAMAALKRQGRAMVTHTGVATDPDQQAYLMAQISTARAIGRLAEAGGTAFWEQTPAIEETTENLAENTETPISALLNDDRQALLMFSTPATSGSPKVTATENINSTMVGTSGDAPGVDGENPEPGPETPGSGVEDAPDSSRDRPDEQDNRTAEKWIRERIRGGRVPTYEEVAKKYDFSRTWARNRVLAARDQMTARGYRFRPGNVVVAPLEEVPQAATLSPIVSVNGSSATSVGGAS